MMTMDILITPRLTLRPPIALDADDIAHWLSDWDVTKMLAFVPWPYGVEDAEKWIASTVDPEKQIYTIHRQSLIGVAGLFGSGDTRSLGYWLGRPWHRHGFMLEALTCLFDLAFSNLEIDFITSGAAIDNSASLELQHRLGFEITGQKQTYFVPRKSQVVMATTLLTRENWLGRFIGDTSMQDSAHQQQAAEFTT
jgi:RimJ/RimL family protein N-acetyltransferase